MSDPSHLIAISLGTIDYVPAWELQRRLHERVVAGELPNVLLLLEHPHVYTLGRRGKLSDILIDAQERRRLGVDVRHADRGGEVTYHGPGQLVAYPIVNLRAWGGGPMKYVRALEEVLVATLAEFGIAAGRGQRPTGVWVGAAKIAAIGVKVSRGVTIHGFALNVDPDLSFFDHIVPCGMPEGLVTSMSREARDTIAVRIVLPVLARHFGQVFGWDIEWGNLRDMQETVGPAAPIAAAR